MELKVLKLVGYISLKFDVLSQLRAIATTVDGDWRRLIFGF